MSIIESNALKPSKEMNRILLSLIFFGFLIGPIFSQTRNCGTMEYLQAMQANDPGLKPRMEEIERKIQQFVSSSETGQKLTTTITIPVVFHILYNTATQNISDNRILDQLDVLNKDFARLNADRTNTPAAFSSIASASPIQFCLAKRDPSGKATSGIIRKSTTTTSFSTNDNMKFASTGGSDAWPSSSYLNIWVCNLGNNILGYAQFPGGASATDGVVLLTSSVGGPTYPGTISAYNLGRTATHEVGHWLNLYHIWGDDNGSCTGSDGVTDTPNQANSNGGCPVFPTVTCNNGPNGDMFMNYMDYTYDNCMNMFTAGQSTRMQAILAGTRSSIQTSLGCTPPVCGIPSGLQATNITSSSAYLSWANATNAQGYNIQYRVVGTSAWTSASSPVATLSLSNLSPATSYEYQVQSVCSSTQTSSFSASYSFTTNTVDISCGTPTGLSANGITDVTATLNWQMVTGALSYNVQYRVFGTSNWNSISSTTNSIQISGLTSFTNYEFAVQSVCSSLFTSVFSLPQTFTTLQGTGCATPIGLTSSNITSSGATLSWTAVTAANSYNIQYRLNSSTIWSTATSSSNTFTLTGLTSSSTYVFQVQASCSGVTSAFSGSQTFITLSSACTDAYESNNTLSAAKTIAVNSSINALISSSTDQDYFKFTTVSPNTNFLVTLSNLPANYDLRIYSSSGKLLATSANTGTTNEGIKGTTTSAGTYYLRINGSNGAFNTSKCYNLSISAGSSAFKTVVSEDIIFEEPLSIYPIPANNVLNLNYKAPEDGTINLNFIDLMGRSVMKINRDVIQGNNSIEGIDISELVKGIYFLEASFGSEKELKRFVISR